MGEAALEVLPEGWESWPPSHKQALLARLQLAAFRAKYRTRWAAFARECIEWPEGEGLESYQEEALEALVHDYRYTVRGPHGLGKTTIASLALLAFALTRDGADNWKAPTAASKHRQLKEFLWPEVHIWVRRVKWAEVGRPAFDEPRELQDLALRLSTGSAFAVASNDPAAIEGAHADQVFYVYDEAKTIPEDLFDATEGAFSNAGEKGREAFALATSTPGEPQGRFYAIHARKPGYEDWTVRHVSLAEAMAAGRITEKWRAQRALQWGEASAIYANRVEGEFAASEEQSVVPLSWLEEAHERWRELAVRDLRGGERIPPEALPPFTCIGADWADTGEDQSAVAVRHGDVVAEVRRFPFATDTMQSAGRVVGILTARAGGYVVSDSIGVGAGPTARLRELGFTVESFVAGAKSFMRDETGEMGFYDLRAEAWWGFRQRLNPASGSAVAIPPDDQLTGDLTAPRWWTTSDGTIRIESKDDLRKADRIGRSTDVGDAVIQAFHVARFPATMSVPSGTA